MLVPYGIASSAPGWGISGAAKPLKDQCRIQFVAPSVGQNGTSKRLHVKIKDNFVK